METASIIKSSGSLEPAIIEPWPSELGLKVFIILISISIWFGLIISIIGIVYVALIAMALFFTHLLFVAMVRGNAVRIGPRQFPDLYERVVRICKRAGLAYVPETYIMQAGGSLNALATKFMRSRMIIIFSDLLDACADDEKAQDMIIGHEIGHIKQGHLDAYWFLLPGLFVPFLGSAYSRACEYTCDRYGFALADGPQSCLKGLAVLAAGEKYGRKVDYVSFVKQWERLDTGFMTLGVWLMSHPPLCDRIAALDKALGAERPRSTKGPARALAILLLFFLLGIGGTAAAAYAFVKIINKSKTAAAERNAQADARADSLAAIDSLLQILKGLDSTYDSSAAISEE